MAARKNRNRQRRRRGRFGFLYKLLSFLIIFAAILVGCVAFFRVNEVVVTGNERYSAEEIIAASGVGLGDNLFLVNKPQTTASIMRHLPYVERVTPVRRLPDTIEFHITESQAVAAIRIEVTVEVEGVAQTETDWWLINASGKLLEREKVLNNPLKGEDRFLWFGVNVRFFNIQNTSDSIVDTLGMTLLYLEDLQYHFHDMDPNWVVRHAYTIASYCLANSRPIKDGDTVDGVADNGNLDQSIQWKCRFEDAIVKPGRPVLDINMDQYAAGGR